MPSELPLRSISTTISYPGKDRATQPSPCSSWYSGSCLMVNIQTARFNLHTRQTQVTVLRTLCHCHSPIPRSKLCHSASLLDLQPDSPFCTAGPGGNHPGQSSPDPGPLLLQARHNGQMEIGRRGLQHGLCVDCPIAFDLPTGRTTEYHRLSSWHGLRTS